MKTTKDQLLRNPDIQPSSDVIAQALGESNNAYIVNFHIISDWFNHNKTDRNVRKTVKIMAG